MLVRYDDAMASIETSWTTYHDLVPVNCPMVYGTKGAMTAAQIDGKDCVKVILPDGEEEYYYPPELEYQYRDIACAFVHNMDTNEPVHATLALRSILMGWRFWMRVFVPVTAEGWSL
mgnify:CR=1 FL=1